MKLESKYFDRIRIKRPQEAGRTASPGCDWPGCDHRGCHLAPKGRGREGQFFRYCLHHVRQYNKTYNYFNGMSDSEISDFQKASITGHRPTWQAGVNSWSQERIKQAKRVRGFNPAFETSDPYGFFGDAGDPGARPAPSRPIRNAERKSLAALNLDDTASAEDIKANYKMLVKLHHPDSHGGDRSSEDKLREVINAYHYLKQAGLC